MAASYIASAEEELSCPLCMELFVDPNTPKQLDCPHVYCEKCLTQMVKGGVRIITCPECRMPTRVPPKTPVSEGGVAALRTSIRLRNLAENHLKHTEKLEASEPPSNETRQPKSSVPKCPIHEDEKLYFYCVTCKVLVCQVCGFLDHDKSTHEIKGVKAIYEEKLQNMKEIMKSANDEAQKHEQCKKQVDKFTALTEHEINRATELAVTKVNRSAAALKAKLQEMNQKFLVEYQKQKEELDRANQTMENMVADVREGTGNEYEYVTKHDQLVEQFKKLSNNQHLETVTTCKLVLEQVDQLGKLVSVRKLNQTQSITQHGKHIDGANGVLAICQQNTVLIYRKQPTDEYKHELDLAVKDACDVAVTATGKYMVVTPSSVEIFTPKGLPEKTFYKTKDRDNVGATRPLLGSFTETLSCIAVLAHGIVVIGYGDYVRSGSWSRSSGSTVSYEFPIRWNQGPIKLAVLTRYGKKTKNINLGFATSTQCIFTSMKGSQVALCDQDNKVVYVLDVTSGKMVHSVDIEDEVRCVCYDEVSDCLMIGTCTRNRHQSQKYGRIWQYCVNPLQVISSYSTGKGIPEAMTFVDTNELAVVTRLPDSNTIQIYKCIG